MGYRSGNLYEKPAGFPDTVSRKTVNRILDQHKKRDKFHPARVIKVAVVPVSWQKLCKTDFPEYYQSRRWGDQASQTRCWGR
jgi:hypothetical protein